LIKITEKSEYISADHIPYDHIACIKNADGSMVDLDCTVEELKGRTDYL